MAASRLHTNCHQGQVTFVDFARCPTKDTAYKAGDRGGNQTRVEVAVGTATVTHGLIRAWCMEGEHGRHLHNQVHVNKSRHYCNIYQDPPDNHNDATNVE